MKDNGTEYYTESLTGYSRVTNSIASRLCDLSIDCNIADYAIDEDVTIITPSEKARCKVYGVGITGEKIPSFGKHKLPYLLKVLKPGLLILIGDLRMYDYVVDIPDIPSTIAVLPIDGHPVPETWFPTLSKFDEIVTVSEFGRGELKKVGFDSTLIPFGINTNTYFPYNENIIKELKKRADLLEEKWIWLFVGRNQPRKNLPDLFLAYKKFNEIYPDESVLHIHSYPKDEAGWDLFDLARYYGIENNVRFTKRFFDVTQLMLNSIYNVADTHISATMSEGFGLTHIESMATGKPQIVPNHTALSELAGPNCGELVKITGERIGTALVHKYLPSIDDFVKKMGIIYENPGLKDWYSRNALKKANKYSWDLIIPKWLKLLEGY